MARIAGIDLPKNKRIEIALTYIYGIGRPTAQKVLEMAKINRDTKSDDLTEIEVNTIRQIIDTHLKVEGDLRSEVSMSIKRLMDLGSYGQPVGAGPQRRRFLLRFGRGAGGGVCPAGDRDRDGRVDHLPGVAQRGCGYQTDRGLRPYPRGRPDQFQSGQPRADGPDS